MHNPSPLPSNNIKNGRLSSAACIFSSRSAFLCLLMGSFLTLNSCKRTGNDVWEDTKSAGRHVQRGLKSLAGDPGQSRQINSRDEFEAFDEEAGYADPGMESYQARNQAQGRQDFIPLADQPQDELAMADMLVRQPQESPGEPGSSIPPVETFRDPSTIPYLRPIFNTIYFDYDSSAIKGESNLHILHRIADYMRQHPELYVVVEGHTDERGPQAYNLALGSRRANTVRNFLVDQGISPDNLFIVSYGKERPLVLEHREEGWSKNRRAEFKIYER